MLVMNSIKEVRYVGAVSKNEETQLNSKFFRSIQDLKVNTEGKDTIVMFPGPTMSSINLKQDGSIQSELTKDEKKAMQMAYKEDTNEAIDLVRAYGYEYIKPNNIGERIYDMSEIINNGNNAGVEIPLKAQKTMGRIAYAEDNTKLVPKRKFIDFLFMDVDLFAPITFGNKQKTTKQRGKVIDVLFSDVDLFADIDLFGVSKSNNVLFKDIKDVDLFADVDFGSIKNWFGRKK